MIPREVHERALALHRRIPVLAGYFEYYGYDSLFMETGAPQCDLEKLDASNVRGFGIALANGGGPLLALGPDEGAAMGDADWAFERLLHRFDAAMESIRACPRVRVAAVSSDFAPRADDESIHVIPLVTSHLWMRDIAAIDALFARGLRISHCAGETWCRSFKAPLVNGRRPPVLSEFGREAVARMNALGIIPDMAHMSDESAQAIVEASTKPVMDGHTCSRTAVPHSRGLSDDTLRKIADGGGVAGVHFADHLFTARVWGPKYPIGPPPGAEAMWAWHRHLLTVIRDPDQRMQMRKNRAEQEKFFRANDLTPPAPASAERIATVADMAEQIERLVSVMGLEHVGLGGDVNGITNHSWPIGMDHVGQFPNLTAELLRRGWAEEDVEKLLFRNWLRLFRDGLPGGQDGSIAEANAFAPYYEQR